MSQRSSLLNAGYCANAPALYYSRAQLAGQHIQSDDTRVRQVVAQFRDENEKGRQEWEDLLRKAADIANQFEIEPPVLPGTPEQFFAWLPDFVEAFESSFPMSRIDHYYFLFGRKCAELYVNFQLACTCISLDLSLDRALDLNRRIEKCLKDNEYILFKLIAPAALLSSEQRQNFFNVFYKKMNSAFEPYRSFEAAGLSPEKMQRLNDELVVLSNEIKSGYEGCLTAMKDLGV